MWQVPWSRFNQFVNKRCFPETWQRLHLRFQVETWTITFRSWRSFICLWYTPLCCCAWTALKKKKAHFTIARGKTSDNTSGIPTESNLIQSDKICKWQGRRIHPVFFDGQALPNPPTHWHIGNMFQGMTLAYPLTLNHCQSLGALGSLGNRNRSNITSPPICLALAREVHAVFMPVWDGFKLFSYQKAHSDILFERHRKPQISQPPFNHMSSFKRPESDLLPRRAVTVKEWDVIYHSKPHTEKITRALALVRICARKHTHASAHRLPTPSPLRLT